MIRILTPVRCLAAGSVAALVLAGCVPKSALIREQKRGDDLSTQVAQLTSKNAQLEDELSKTRQSADELAKMKADQEQMMKDLESEVQAGQIKISEIAGKISINMVDKILFPSGSAKLKPEGEKVLLQVAKAVKSIKDKRINVSGHTDNEKIGPDLVRKWPTNWELSSARATAVVRFLQEKAGVPPTMLEASAYGEYQPVADNATDEGRAQNRRIELLLIPTKETLTAIKQGIVLPPGTGTPPPATAAGNTSPATPAPGTPTNAPSAAPSK